MTELEELRLAYAECSRQRFELLAKLKNLLQEPEPVAWKETDEVKCPVCNDKGFPWPKCGHITYLERTPPKREWQGLTDDELEELRRSDDLFEDAPMWGLIVRAIEAKLKEKNT